MRLTYNKIYKIMGNVNCIYFGASQSIGKIMDTNSIIFYNQNINLSTSLTSNYSIGNIYNEINEE